MVKVITRHPPVARGVWYEELEGSPTIKMDRQGGSARRVVRIAWRDIDRFFAELFPSPYNGYGTARFPGYPWLIVDGVSVEPFDPTGMSGRGEPMNVFPSGAKVTVDYKPPSRDQGMQGGKKGDPSGPGGGQGSTGGSQNQGKDVTFVTHKIGCGGEFVTWPSKCLEWSYAANGRRNQPPQQYEVGGDTVAGIVVPMIEHTISWHEVLWPPWRAIRQCMGKINAYRFAGAAVGTLLFLGAEASREFTTQGLSAWTLEYKFSEKNMNSGDPDWPAGWNHFLRPDGVNAGQFQPLLRKTPVVNLGRGVRGAPETKLTAAVSNRVVRMTVDDRFANFPSTQQFRIMIEPGHETREELCAVVAGMGTNTWTVLRGLNGWPVVRHPVNSLIRQTNSRVYDLADFRYLFQPFLPLI